MNFKKIVSGLAAALILVGCGNDNSSSAKVPNQGSLQIALKYVAPQHIDSLVLLGYGADTVHYRLDASDRALDIDLLPATWKFDAKLYAKGIVMQRGEGESEIRSGEKSYLQLALKALYGFIDVKIPLGLGNPLGIAKGTLTLKSKDSTYSYNLSIEKSFAYFESGALPLNTWFDVSLNLYNANNEVLFFSKDSLYLDQKNAGVNWSISSLKGSLSISIVTEEINRVEVGIDFLSREKRIPKTGEAIFSEFNAIPKAGTNFEFVEIYNATLDTLLLDNCVIALKGSNSSNVSLPVNSILLPAGYIVFGADSTEFRHPENWFKSGLTNTKASLSLVCNDEVIDSIVYSITAESGGDSIRIESSASSQLDLSYWEIHNSGKAWCNDEATPSYASSCYVENDDSDENADY